MHDGTVAISHRTEEHGILTSALIGKILGAFHTKPQKLYYRQCVTKQRLGVYVSFGKILSTLHTKPQKLYARQCVTKQCLGVYASLVTDVHLKLCDRRALKFCNLPTDAS